MFIRLDKTRQTPEHDGRTDGQTDRETDRQNRSAYYSGLLRTRCKKGELFIETQCN